jgi:hypothetical protein
MRAVLVELVSNEFCAMRRLDEAEVKKRADQLILGSPAYRKLQE